MAHGVYNEAIVDIVSSDSLASQPYLLKDLHLNSTTPRNLDFSSPFTLTSTTPKRTKIHAFVLYFDTFFTTTGDAVPPSVPVKVTKEGDVTLAEVWPVGGKAPPQRRASMGAGLKQKEDRRVTSFSTGPDSQPTHWKQTVFLLREPILAEEGMFLVFVFSMERGLLRVDGWGRHYRDGHVLLQEKRYELSRAGCGDPLFFETECWDDGSGGYGGSDIQSTVIFFL
jgi:protein arginine N-methyltransferase 3